MSRLLSGIAVAAMVLGSASTAYTAGADKELTAIQALCNSAMTTPQAAILNGKLPIVDLHEINAGMMANAAFPTADEAKAITDLDAFDGTCRSKMLDYLQRKAPVAYPIFQDTYMREQMVLADLSVGKLTYGAADRLLYEVLSEGEQRLVVLQQQAQAQADQDRQARQTAFMNALSTAAALSRAAQPYTLGPAPTSTTCRQMGYTTFCNTQ